jgi:hypothetical protein
VTAARRICCRRASSNIVARSKRLYCVYASYGIFGIRRIVEAKEDWLSSTYIVCLEVENVVAPIAAMAALPKNYPIAGCINDSPARVLKSCSACRFEVERVTQEVAVKAVWKIIWD